MIRLTENGRTLVMREEDQSDDTKGVFTAVNVSYIRGLEFTESSGSLEVKYQSERDFETKVVGSVTKEEFDALSEVIS